MRASWFVVPVVVTVACSSSPDDKGKSGSPDGGPGVDAAVDGAEDGASAPLPPGTCALPVPLVDTTNPTTVVGTGTPASCTEAALDAAAETGGIITFDCGPVATTISVTAEIVVTANTTIDGGNLVTLSGGGTTRILHLMSAANLATPLLTVQNLAFTDGYTTATTEGGAAIFEDGGSLTVINCTFTNNQCATTGGGVSGGAINGQGARTLIVEGSTFSGNSGSNGGAIGTEDETATVVNSTFVGNKATGTGGSSSNGGNGGAMSFDGANVSWTMCGDLFSQNAANAAGGAIFRVAYDDEAVDIDQCTFDRNAVDPATGNAGAAYLEYATITMTNTTLSGNAANYGGGIWIGHDAIAALTNDTIANNTANMGGGIWFADGVTGTVLNVTVADNAGNGIAGGGTGVTLQNTLVEDNLAGNDEGAVSCDATHAGAGVNMEYPGDTSSPCTSSVVVADAQLGQLASNGGGTDTMAPSATSPAIAQGTGCPATDQRGHTRPNPCTLGAYEVQ